MMKVQGYLTNIFVFCNPSFNYNNINFQTKNIIFIDKGKNKNDVANYIPCLFIQEYEQSSKFLIFFHGNADDIFSSELLGQHFCENLKMNVIIVEYPGYSIYKSDKSAEVICENSLIVYSFIKQKFKARDEDIFVVGRSLGTGPAIYLSSKEKPKSLILISPFKSIKSVTNAFFSFFLLDIFKSIDIINKVSSPILFIHGLNDPLIDFSHSEELIAKAGKNGEDDIVLNPHMTHNDFDVEKDIFTKILKFLKDKPDSFPKHAFNLDDDQFKNLFDIPVAVQKYLFKLNIQSSNPSIFEKKAKCSLLLNDGRIALGMNNSEINIYNIDWCLNEKEITIKLKDGYPIQYMTQLKNNIFVACDALNIYFFSLTKYKSKLINCFNGNAQIKKVENLNEKEIIILYKESIVVLNENFEKITEKTGNYKDLIVASNKIIASTSKNIEIIEYFNNNKLVVIDTLNYEIIDSIYSLINFDNLIIGLGTNEFLIYNLNDNSCKRVEHNIDEPSYIWKIDFNSFLICNRSDKIIYFEYSNKKCEQYPINCINSKYITSIIKLFDGSIIITTNPIDKNEKEDCKMF